MSTLRKQVREFNKRYPIGTPLAVRISETETGIRYVASACFVVGQREVRVFVADGPSFRRSDKYNPETFREYVKTKTYSVPVELLLSAIEDGV